MYGLIAKNKTGIKTKNVIICAGIFSGYLNAITAANKSAPAKTKGSVLSVISSAKININPAIVQY